MPADDFTPAALERAGRALFGGEWQTDLARALEMGEHGSRTIRRWMGGQRSIPPNLAGKLRRLIAERIALLRSVRQHLPNKRT